MSTDTAGLPKPDYCRLSNLQSGLDDYYLASTVRRLVEAARAEERERCAKVCDPLNDNPEDWTEYARTRADCAAAIRTGG